MIAPTHSGVGMMWSTQYTIICTFILYIVPIYFLFNFQLFFSRIVITARHEFIYCDLHFLFVAHSSGRSLDSHRGDLDRLHY